jgi:hypothetical protein
MKLKDWEDLKTEYIVAAMIVAILLLMLIITWLLSIGTTAPEPTRDSFSRNISSESSQSESSATSSSESSSSAASETPDPDTSDGDDQPNRFEYDHEGLYITSQVQLQGVYTGLISSENNSELGFDYPIELTEPVKRALEQQFGPRPTKTLDTLLPAPINAPVRNRLIWQDYNIDAPIVHSSLTDLFNIENGTINFYSYVNNDPVESPIQQKLTQGVVHVAYTPLPGEIGNSYIIGHSSNYLGVQSEYNEVFRNLERAGNTGEVFTIFDHEGRKLDFRVFESFEVVETEVNRAYNQFDQSARIVTLQASILEEVNGVQQPTRRWLIRGELIPNQVQVGGGGG